MPSFEETYFDALRSIETAIIGVHVAQPEAKDRHVDDALSALIRTYNAALKNKRPPNLKFSGAANDFYADIKAALEAHMSGEGLGEDTPQLTLEEAAECAKRIRRSVTQMMRKGGPTAYLVFVQDYHANADDQAATPSEPEDETDE